MKKEFKDSVPLNFQRQLGKAKLKKTEDDVVDYPLSYQTVDTNSTSPKFSWLNGMPSGPKWDISYSEDFVCFRAAAAKIKVASPA